MGQVELSRAFIWSVAGQEFPMRESLAKTLGKGGPTSMGPCFPPLSLSPTLLASINLVSPDCTSLQWARWLSSGSKFLQAWARQARDSMSMQKDEQCRLLFLLGHVFFPLSFSVLLPSLFSCVHPSLPVFCIECVTFLRESQSATQAGRKIMAELGTTARVFNPRTREAERSKSL